MKKRSLIGTIPFLIPCLSAAAAVNGNTLYLVGKGTPAGWNEVCPEEMMKLNDRYGIFIWEGILPEGDFKFLNARGSWDTSIVADEADKRFESGRTYPLVDNTSGGHNDFKFYNDKEGWYRIVANLNDMTVRFTAPSIVMSGSSVLRPADTSIPENTVPVFPADDGAVVWTGQLRTGSLAGMKPDGKTGFETTITRDGMYTLRYNPSDGSVDVAMAAEPDLNGAFRAAGGRYLVALDTRGNRMYSAPVPTRLYVSDGEVVTEIPADRKASCSFKTQMTLRSDRQYTFAASKDKFRETRISPVSTGEVNENYMSLLIPDDRNPLTVTKDGIYKIAADFSGEAPRLSVTAALNTTPTVICQETGQHRVSVEGRCITVSGIWDDVRVFDMAGRTVGTSRHTPVAPGVYIVAVDNYIEKIAVR